ncbi:DUF3164 family protein [Pseudoxanthomonas sp. UTMC 1351]|uniref:DUF3164 family protein n=1 Tax=Pseudoxanthomonas sp. UTMC 1351 TaxID=2695853 RepID=UPI0034CEB36C
MPQPHPDIPAGYRQDNQGRLVAASQIRPIDLQRDELVQELVAKARDLSTQIGKFKTESFNDIAAFVSLSAEAYGVKLGGTKGNISLLSFDGRYKVQRAIAEAIVFDERLQAAKSLIDECLREWTEGARTEVRTLVQDAFRVDKAGNIRTAQVLGLRRLDITDERWLRAMQAIGDAVQVVGSKSYVRIYERDEESGQYHAIPLDVAGA